jgi:hypothetical protein
MTLQIDTRSELWVETLAEMMSCTNLGWRAANSVGGCLVAVCRTHIGEDEWRCLVVSAVRIYSASNKECAQEPGLTK